MAGDLAVTLPGQGVAPVQSVSAGTALVRLGTTGSASVTIKNIGDGNLSGLGADSNLAGTVSAATGTFTGSGATFSLLDNASQNFSFAYTPASRAVDTAPLAIHFTNGNSDNTNQSQDVTATLSAQGVGPTYQSDLAPNSTLDFGTGTPGAITPLILKISNISTDANGGNSALTDLTILSVALSGQDSSLFKIAGFAPGAVLHEGDLLDLEIDYTGRGPDGTKLASLTITTDEGVAARRDWPRLQLRSRAPRGPRTGVDRPVGNCWLGFGRMENPRQVDSPLIRPVHARC